MSASPATNRNLLGVLGGMGPAATAYFYRTLIELTPAGRDQDHLPVVIWADARVPDRTAALTDGGPSPVAALVAGTRWLRAAGASTIAVPCNTAHAFLDDVYRATGADFLDMPRAAVGEAVGGGGRRLGLLATRGTRHSRIYDVAAAAYGVELVNAAAPVQGRLVDPAIDLVKAGGPLDIAEQLIAEATRALAAAGADVVVAGCTEIPLVISRARQIVPIVDATASLARAAVARMTSVSLTE